MPWLDEGGQPVADKMLLQSLGAPPAATPEGSGGWKDESGNPVADPMLLQSLGHPGGMGGETGGKSYGPAPFSRPMPNPLAGAWDSFANALKSAVPSIGQGVLDAQVAGAQGTNPDASTSGYVKAPQSAQAMFDETGKVPDEQNMAALRDPDTGKYAVYYRSPDAAEGRVTSAARSITSGLVAGGPPGVGAAISGAVSPVLNGVKTAGNIVGIGSGETKALSKIAGAVAASEKGGGPGALDMTGQLAGGTGKQPVALVDLSPELQALYGQAARVPGPGRTAATKFLENRDAGAGSRLTADLNEALGGDKTAFQTATDLTTAQKEAAAPAYEKAFSQPAWSPRLQEFLDQPEMKAGLNQGMKMERLDAVSDGRPFNPTSMGVDIDAEGNVKLLDTPNTRVLDAGKRGLDAMIAAERNDVTGKLSPLGRSYAIFRDKYLAEMDKLNPDYATARAAFSGPASSMDAIKLGSNIFKMSPEEIGQAISKLDPGNRQFVRLGVESALRKTIAQTGPAGDEARALLKNNYVQQQLKPLFGSEADFDKVINAAKNESMMAKTKRAVLGGSDTAARLTQDATGEGGGLLRPIAEAGAAFGTGEPILGAKAAYGFLQALKARATGMTPSVAEQIISLLGDPSMSGDISRAHAALAGPRRVQLPPGLLQPAPSATAAGGLLSGPSANQR